MKCPVCQTESSGPFCHNCGAALKGARCKACNAALAAGARYCTQCGEAVRRGAGRLPWYIAAGSVAALLVVVAIMLSGSGRGGADAGTAPVQPLTVPPPGAGGPLSPLTGTPREQADRLFNRVMEERAGGDTAQAEFFAPMAVQAYEAAGPLDDDGLYHLSLLQTEAKHPVAGRATAEKILAGSPDHLLALAAAALAAARAGDSAAARGYYDRFLKAYDAERGKPLPEYADHSRIFPEYKQAAEQFLRR